jgi:DNA-binding MarR family transcriptional regulator
MTKPAAPIAGSKLPGGLDHSEMFQLLGYNIAQASIPAFALFDKYIGVPLKLRRTDYTILVLLACNQEVTPKKLSSALSVTGPKLTTILDKLEAREMIKRSRSESDGRVQYLSLTAKGRKTLEKARVASGPMEEDLTRHLTSAEYATLRELLQKVAVHRR